MRLAILADIHGNLPALEAVIADLDRYAPDEVVLAGDQINRCPWSAEVLDLVATLGWPAIAGNHEWVVSVLDTPSCPPIFQDRVRYADVWHTWSTLSPRHFAMLAALPFERRLDGGGGPAIRLLHGIKENPFEGYTVEMSEARMVELMEDIAETVVVGAHTHVPMMRWAGGRQVFNPGSVGMPYNGDPRAQYLILEGDGNRWEPIFRQVEYDRARVRDVFVEEKIAAHYGPLGPLYMRTLMTGQPWASDFLIWLRAQGEASGADLGAAVDAYLTRHGPGHWAFLPPR
jgi:predicted phosphodiesterase